MSSSTSVVVGVTDTNCTTKTVTLTRSKLEDAKRLAARSAVDEFIKSDTIIGIGSGSTVIYAVERLAERYNLVALTDDQPLKNIICVPSSFQATQLLVEAKLPIGDLNQYPELDVAIDGADEVDKNLNCIKGGGGCQLQEKIIIANSKKFVIIADYRKESTLLGESWVKGVPIEVLPMAYVAIRNRLLSKWKGTAVLRMATKKAGPVITDNGNVILDTNFGTIQNPSELEKGILQIPGVIEVGLFCNLATKAFFGQEDGTVTTRNAL